MATLSFASASVSSIFRTLRYRFRTVGLLTVLMLLAGRAWPLSSVATGEPLVTADPALLELAAAYYQTVARSGGDAVRRFWDEASPEAERGRKDLDKLLSAYRSFGPPALRLHRMEVRGDWVRIRLSVDLPAVETQTGESTNAFPAPRALRCRFDDGRWRIWDERPSVADLVQTVAAGLSDEVVADVMADAPEEVTAELAAAAGEESVQRVRRRDLPGALQLLQRTRLLAKAAGSPRQEASTLNRQGVIWGMMGRYDRAVPCLEESLPLWPPEDVLPLASTYLNLGLALAGQGELDRALSMYRHSLSLQEASGNGRADPRTLVNMGTLYYDLGNYRAALDCYLRSQGLPGPDDPARTAKMFINIGNIHSRQGDQKQALDHYRRALEILQPLAPHPAIAIAENNIGSAYEQLGDYRLALEHFQKSLALRNPQEPEGIASVRGNIAATYLALGNPGEAETNWLESLRLYEQMGFMVGIARIHGELAYFRFKTGRLDEALAEAEKAIAIARPRGLADLLSRALTTAGSVHLAMGQSREARRDFDEAIQVIETMRSRLAGGEESKESFLEDRLSPYQEVVSLLVQQNRAAEALSYAERAKARVLGDILREGRDRSERFMTPVEREEQERLATELASLNTRLAQAGADSAVLAELQDRQREARLRLEEFQFRLGAAHPELAAARGEAAPLGPDQLLALVPDEQTALLDYLALPDRTYLFVLTRDPGRRPRPHISVYTLDLTKSNALERIRDFRERILDSDPAVGRSAQSLYDLLIRPAEEHLQQRNRLVVSPDGILWDLPFAALQSTFNRSLMEEYAITFTPSLSVWQSMRYRAASFTGQTGAVSLLAFGNPRLPQGGEAGTFAPLPEAEKEVKALVPIYEPDEARVYTGSDADEARFKAQAPHARILHLATHGVLDGASPLYSYLALAPDGSEEDGFLEARELLEMDLHADVAVLSACETARGRIGAGEGVIGLSWALFAAGCTTTVVSLWPVESAATTEMMVAFHRGLRGSGPGGRPPLPPAEALRQAALSLRRQPSTRHPFYWAGFLVMGRGF